MAVRLGDGEEEVCAAEARLDVSERVCAVGIWRRRVGWSVEGEEHLLVERDGL